MRVESPAPSAPSGPRAPTVHVVRANGLDHRLLEWAPPTPLATVMLLHGFMDAGGTWDWVAHELVLAGLKVLAPDLRGFGEAPRAPPGSNYHFPDYSADVAGLLDEGVPSGAPLFLVGHSMGGTIATMVAGAFPERITKLALLEGLGPPDGGIESMPDRVRMWIEQTNVARTRDGRALHSMEEAYQRLAANHPDVDEASLRGQLPKLVRALDGGRVAWLYDPLHRAVSPMPFFAKGYMAFAARITCPVLHVSGGPGGFHVEDEAERLAAFRRIEHAELPDAGHMMHWTRPKELAAALVRFWNA